LDSAWPHRQRVTISGALAKETLTNFPVLVQLAEQTNAVFRKTQVNGQDIVFTAADGVTRLAHEIDSFRIRSTETKALNAWVRIPELPPGTDTVLYMYYGNLTAADQQDKAALWAEYAGVWHLDEDKAGLNATTEVYRDSTTNAYHGKDWVSTNTVAGRIGNGANLDGDDYIALTRTLNTTNDFTVTAWVRPDVIDWEPIVGDASGRYFAIPNASQLSGRSNVSNTINSHNMVYGGNARLTLRDWHHVAFRSTGEAGATRRIYQNGTNVTAGTNVALVPPLAADPWTMIGKWGSTECFHGVLDEVRISDKALPPAWFDTEFRNAAAPSAYVAFGPEEGSALPPPLWPASYFAYRQEITVWPAVTEASFTNFPMLVAITNQNNHLFQIAAADGRDILFTDADGVTRLPHEIERYSAAAPASLYAWVRLPVLSPTARTRIYLYYGNNSTPDRQDRTNVWSEGYLGVWHLGEAVSNGQTNFDSTASAAHGVFQDAGGRGGGDAEGKIAGADAFAGFEDHYVLTPGVLCPSNGFTISAWIRKADTNTFTMFESGNLDRLYFGVNLYQQGIVSIDVDQNLQRTAECNGIQQDAWHQLVAVCQPPRIKMYLDGNYATQSGVFTNLNAQRRGMYIGRWSPVKQPNPFKGSVDELRISGVTRTAEWIKAGYIYQNEPCAYLSFETPEYREPSGTMITIF